MTDEQVLEILEAIEDMIYIMVVRASEITGEDQQFFWNALNMFCSLDEDEVNLE